MQDNKTRRAILRTSLAVAAGTLAAAGAAQAQDEKIAQQLVQYQNQPKDGQQCNKCAQWIEPNACKIVAGTISPQGYCVAFAPKEG